MLVAKVEEHGEYQEVLIDFITTLRKKYLDKFIITNRGFEIFDKVKHLIDGVAAESLFYGLDSKRNYRNVPEEDRRWFLSQQNIIKSYGLPVIVIDYVQPKNKRLAFKVVKRIKSLSVLSLMWLIKIFLP